RFGRTMSAPRTKFGAYRPTSYHEDHVKHRYLAVPTTGLLIASALATTAQASAPAAASVVRYSGADRYATSAAIVDANYAPGVPVAYIASGDNFPDALAGGAAAARD